MNFFSDVDLRKMVFKNCRIYDSEFNNTNLTNASFENSDLKNTCISNSNLSFASFKNSKNYIIDPNQNILKKTIFSIPDVIGLLSKFDIKIE